MRFFHTLRQRRVFQIVGIYLGVIFAAFEFTDMIVERYGLSDELVDVVLAGMLSFLPTTIMLAYFHGAPGKDRWHRVEKLGIPLNVLLTGVLILALMPGQRVEAVSEMRTALDENGREFTLEVARADLIKRVAVFFPEPDGFETETPWEAYATTLMIAESVRRDPFIGAYTLYENYSNGLIWLIKRAGYASGLGAPVSLLRDVADKYYQDYFVVGSLARQDGAFTARLDIYRTESMERIDSQSFSGPDLYAVVERAAEYVKDRLDEKRGQGMVVEHYPVDELLTDDIDALKAYILGKNARLLENDFENAIALWKEAVAMDPNFASAYQDLAGAYSEQGDYKSALANLKELNRLSHKLTDSERILLKAWSYRLRSQVDKAVKVLEMWVELEPENHLAWQSLGHNYLWTGNRVADAMAAYEKSLALMPNQDWLVRQLGDVYRVQGREEDAIATFEKYHQLRPGDYQPLVTIGDIMTERGDLVAAEDYFRKGNLAETNMVTPLVRLALNQASRGNLIEAFIMLDDADFVAQAPRQEAVVLAARVRMRTLMGQPVQALSLLKRQLEAGSKSGGRLKNMYVHMRSIYLYVLADKVAEAEAFIESMAEMFVAPFDFIPSIGLMILRLSEGDLDAAYEHNRVIEKAIEDSGRSDLSYLTDFCDGVILRERGQVAEGLARIEKAVELYNKSIQQTVEDGRNDIEQITLELARTYLAAGQPEDAVASLQVILTPWPYHPEANWILAQAYRDLDDAPAAKGALNKTLKIWGEAEPDYEMARLARAMADDITAAGTAIGDLPSASGR